MDSIVEWIRKKTGIPSNKLNNHSQLVSNSRLVDSLVVYFGPLHINRFKIFLEIAKDFMQQDDVEFAHVDTNTYPENELAMINLGEY